MDRVWEYRMARSGLTVPLAGGENYQRPQQFLALLREEGIDILQPDVNHMESVDAYRDTLHMARHFGMRCSPHAYDGALSRLYAIFAQACLPSWSKMEGDDIEPVEWDVMENPFTRMIDLQPQNGNVPVPSGAGIGVQLDWDLIRSYRWDGSAYH